MVTASEPEEIAIASDHAGYDLKEGLKETLESLGYAVRDLGTMSRDSVDYPVYAEAMAKALAEGRVTRGVIVCGTGIGVAMAANRNPAIRAAVCHNIETARLSRQHNDANVLALGARIVDPETARACLRIFLRTAFEGGRHARRVAMLSSTQG